MVFKVLIRLTPKRHKHGIEDSTRMVEEICQLGIATYFTEVPEVAADITQRAHIEVSATRTHLSGELIGVHCEQSIQEHQQSHHRSWEKPACVET